MEMKAGDNVIKRSLTNNTVVADVAASAEELTNPFVKEGFEVYGRQSKGTKIVDLIKAVEQQESVLGELQKELEDLNAMMIERKN
ncbi:hypothetical protein DEO72_LG8g2381 [Vigna unguiculata]|uniref:Uncharacterized protein n=2 Tax=Vigna unguiculata TaxID=3917 RepID=A0A4D6MWT9_VIGUN|nr:hypothetical protein DEO72_LG8g2381 [Vigna unguiculata]